MKKIFTIFLSLSFLLVIFTSGMIAQKYYGLGNIFKKLNPNYVPTDKQEVIKKNHEGRLSIFILAGQSNMEGEGDVENYKPIDTHNKVYVFNNEYKWIVGKEPVREKIGPSISFAAEIIKKFPDESIGIVNVARGGTNIYQWKKSYLDNSLYQQMIKRALAASAQGQIRGLLFYQGENDAEGKNTDHYNDWDIQFERFVMDVRKDLHNDTLPVVFAEIGKGNGIYWQKVKKCQEKVDINLVSMIKTDDIENKKGSVHFTTKGYIEIGNRFADKFITEYMTPLKTQTLLAPINSK